MTFFQAITLGLVQGLGEFLPISSSAHLKVLRWLAGWQIAHEQAVDVALHLGTLAAVLIYFRSDLVRLAQALVHSVSERRIGDDPQRRLAWWLLIGTVPAGLAGLAFEHQAEASFGTPLIIAWAMILLGLGLYFADQFGPQRRNLDGLTLRDALLIGAAQACAIVPGVSRSGGTITAGRLLGFDRSASARFSFLLATPLIAGAGLKKIPELLHDGGIDAPLLVAMGVSGLTGYLAIGGLLRLIRTRSYLLFTFYRVLFGIGLLVLWRSRV